MSLSLGLGLALTRNKGGRLFPQASAGWDFVRGAYKNAAGYVRTNLHLNNSFAGAQVGVVGSGGALPTGWFVGEVGLTTTILSLGTRDGIPVMRVRIQLNNTSGFTRYPGIALRSPVAPSAQYVGSFWYEQIAISGNGGASPLLNLQSRNGNTYLANLGGTSPTLPTAWSRSWVSGLSHASANELWMLHDLALPTGNNLDWTFEIGADQIEPGAYPSSVIRTSGTAASVTTYTSTNPADVGNMTFTRASTGYAEDAQGNLVLFGSGVPRITSKGVLIEPAATNVLPYSFDDTPNQIWPILVAATISTGSLAPRAQGATVTLMTTTATSGRIQRNLVIANDSLARVFAVDVEKKSASYTIAAGASNGAGVVGSVTFNGLTGVITSGGGVVEDKGTWWRVSVTFTNNSTGNTLAYGFVQLNGASGQTAQVALPDMEVGSVATSYKPSRANTNFTRAADVFYYSGVSVTSSFTLAATIDHAFANNGSGLYPVVSIGGSYNNVAAIYRRDASSNYQGLIRSSAAAQADMIAGGAPTTGLHFLALRVNDNQFALAKDGAIISTDTVGTSPALNGDRLAIGTESWSPGSQGVAGYIPHIALFPYATNDAQLQSISSGNF